MTKQEKLIKHLQNIGWLQSGENELFIETPMFHLENIDINLYLIIDIKSLVLWISAGIWLPVKETEQHFVSKEDNLEIAKILDEIVNEVVVEQLYIKPSISRKSIATADSTFVYLSGEYQFDSFDKLYQFALSLDDETITNICIAIDYEIGAYIDENYAIEEI